MVDQRTPTRHSTRNGTRGTTQRPRNDHASGRISADTLPLGSRLLPMTFREFVPVVPETVPAAIGNAASAHSWYRANFASTAGQDAGAERRTARWALLGLIRQQGVSALPRTARCGMPIGNAPVTVKRDAAGGAHVSGRESCASVWSCPVCAASIRSHRADEITRGLLELLRRPTKAERAAGYKASGLSEDQRRDPEQVGRHLAARPVYVAKRPKGLPADVKVHISRDRAGQPVALPATRGGAVLVTMTLPHQAGDRLERTIALVTEAFRWMQRGRAYKRERDAYGILGYVRSFEITHGAHGWHPHLHLVLVTAARLTNEACAELQAAWLARWNRYLTSEGWPEASEAHGVRFDLVRRDAAAVAVYVAKLQEGHDKGKPARKSNVGAEMARGDMKGGRRGSRVPFEILADFGSSGSARDLDLWHEYQLATKGRSAIRWSRGLRDLLLPDEDELSDDAVTEQEAEAVPVATIVAPLWRAIAARPYGEAYLLIAAERGGYDGICRYVRAIGLSDQGVYLPDIDVTRPDGSTYRIGAQANLDELRQLAAERDGD